MKEIIQKHFGNRKGLDVDLFEALMEKKFTMKDIQELSNNITYRTVNHWSEKGYLLSETTEGEWRKFSFAEYIWLLFLNELRELNVSFNNILSTLFIQHGIEDEAFAYLTDSDLSNLKKLDFERLEKRIDKALVLSTFCWELVVIITFKTPLTFRFLKDKKLLAIYGNPAYQGIRVKTFLNKYKENLEKSNFQSTVSISIDSLIKQYIANKDLDNISDLKILTKQEIEILEQIRSGKLKEITIIMENGTPVRLKLKDEINNIDSVKRVQENFFSDYQSCEYVTNGGKSYLLKRTTIKKLEN